MTEQLVFSPTPMTNREHDLLKTLRTHLTVNREDTFTVDTLRQLGFDRFMPKDRLGRINYGSMIAKWHHFGYIESTGETCCSVLASNHRHRETIWRMKQL